ncbi:hypothetical protein GCM10010319_48240 [Streptomyces blastmyceticus]|uniref:Uncharacterized protein n=1 Tax=Streptomyces blastmyceticus TaxID=68180 RepID=A0ABN0XI97_9ACTN
MSGPWSAALYWHMGAIQIRLGMVSERRVRGSKRALIKDSVSAGAADALRLVRETPYYENHRITTPFVQGSAIGTRRRVARTTPTRSGDTGRGRNPSMSRTRSYGHTLSQ